MKQKKFLKENLKFGSKQEVFRYVIDLLGQEN